MIRLSDLLRVLIILLASNAADVAGLVEDIVRSVRSSLAEKLRQHNRQFASLGARLPTELIGSIFSHLSTRDCFAVSQVSYDWRDTALSSPRLWSSPSFLSKQHHESCTCNACTDEHSLRPCRECNRSFQLDIPSSNIAPVGELLLRSREVPISLEVTIRAKARAAAEPCLELSTALQPHADRLTTLHISTDDVVAVEQFLAPFGCFSALRTLTIGYGRRTSGLDFKRVDPLELPLLEALTLTGRITCHETFNLRCPRVTSLTSMFNTARHLRTLLRACPAVETLDLEVGAKSVDTSTETILEEVQSLLANCTLRRVNITRAYRGDVAPVLQLFSTATVQCFRIHFNGTELIDSEDLHMFLGDIGDATRLDCVHPTTNAESNLVKLSLFTGIGDDIRERTVTLQLGEDNDSTDRNFIQVLARLVRRGDIHEVRVAADFWSSIFDGDDLSSTLPTLKTATIEFGNADDAVNHWFAQRAFTISSPDRGQLSSLEHLTLKTCSNTTSMQADEKTADVVRTALGFCGRLRSLTLDGLSTAVDLKVLHGYLADSVHLLP